MTEENKSICTKCGMLYPVHFFHLVSKESGIRRKECKYCRNIITRKSRARNKLKG